MQDIWGKIKSWIEARPLVVGLGGIAVAALGVAFGVAGLSSGGDQSASTATTATTQIVAATTGPTQPGDPVTSSITTPTDSGAARTAVRVDNAPDARPQVGLGAASLVVETPVEGGMTRFTAYYAPGTAPVVVGPVRSVRPVDADLTAPFATTLVATGGQPFVLQDFAPAGIALAMPETAPGFQALERPSPYNLFVNLEQVEAVYPPTAVDEPGLPEGDLPSGSDAASLAVPLGSEVGWDFAGGEYVRTENGEPFLVLPDLETESVPYTVDTVVVMFCAQRSAGYTDGNGVDVPRFDVIGQGRLLVFSGGKVVAGSWARSAQEDPYRFFTESGEPFGVPAGRTHLMVVPRELEVGY